jgi:predicted nicotinamide N-methyase
MKYVTKAIAGALSMLLEDIHPKVVETIKSTVLAIVSDHKVARIDVEARVDSTGDDAIFIDVFFIRDNRPFHPQKSLDLQTEVWDRVYKLGERRFPYVFYHFAKGEGEKA